MKGKVLIIEDAEKWQEILKECIADAGYYVEVVADLGSAISKVEHERFHFITIDMSLKDDGTTPNAYEGWTVLSAIEKLRIKDITPTMVISGYEDEYHEFRPIKNLQGIFFMGKSDFDEEKLLDIINREVDRIDLRFEGDHRQT